MRRFLRSLVTRVISADPPCLTCGRPTFCPGALRSDFCRKCYAERLAAQEVVQILWMRTLSEVLGEVR